MNTSAAFINTDAIVHRLMRQPLAAGSWKGVNKEGGFTLVEVLVTLVILSIGLLGLAALQLAALKNNDSAYLRTQASLYSNEIIDRLRANRGASVAGNYNHTLSAFSDLTAPSGNSAIAQADLYDWYQQLDASLPNARGAVNCDANAICTITVQWDDSRAEGKTALKQVVLAGQL